MTRTTRLALITELWKCFPRITCRPNVGMWRCRRVEMLENENVGLLRCLIVERWRSLVGIWCRERYDVSRPCLGFFSSFACLKSFGCFTSSSSQDEITWLRKWKRNGNMLKRGGNTTYSICFRRRIRDCFSWFRLNGSDGTGPLSVTFPSILRYRKFLFPLA